MPEDGIAIDRQEADLAALIDAYSDFQQAPRAANGRKAGEAFRLHRPVVTLVDLSMPVMDGVDATTAIIAECRGGIEPKG